MKFLLDIVKRHKSGEAIGVYSLCSAHPIVIEAAMREAQVTGSSLLIEATSNQVNQFGGYTGMTPQSFREFVHAIAARCSMPLSKIHLGGDHLGPNCWRQEIAASAMDKSATMLTDYVRAGFRKIHLDCSMACADDPTPLPEALIAERAARLCAAAEQAYAACGGEAPVYIIGTEVPVPGGAQESLATLAVTTPTAAEQTLVTHEKAFMKAGLAAAWQRVIGMVVQPGVEFDHHHVIDYQPAAAQVLSRFIAQRDQVIFEAHTTDYQTPESLSALVRDHFAILKVGPGATFALRETLWALADIESELVAPAQCSQLKSVVLDAMRDNPVYWRPYYTDESRLRSDQQYSFSDRLRYYWPNANVQRACNTLLDNLRVAPVAPTLLSQYLPKQYAAIRAHDLPNQVDAIVHDGVAQALRPYIRACSVENINRGIEARSVQ
jgi:D-tagatose-1,6-bisphosphate aldolase subunit GatZ/KbaZ